MSSILKVDTIQDTSGNNIINESSDTITIGAAGDTVTVPGTEVKTNKVSPTSGTSLQIGDSGDTVNIVGTLQNNGSALAGGITEADQWRLTANFAPNDNNSVFITSNLERADTDGTGYIGTGMSQSSGIFTFPSTGYYLITANGIAQGDAQYMVMQTWTTTDNSNYNVASASWSWGTSNDSYHSSSNCFLFDVTNTSTHKVKFAGYREGSSSHVNFNGDTSQSLTSFNFLRLGDT